MKRKLKRTAQTLRDQGKSLVWVTPTEEEKALIRLAAGARRESMGRFVLTAALAEALDVVREIGEKEKAGT